MPSKLLSKLRFWRRRSRIPDDSSPTPVTPQPTSEDSSPNSFLDSSVPLPSGEFEVFLSFRGPDNRNNFADFLYHYLVRSKIRTFRDNEELRKGEEIWPGLDSALTQSKIYIPILSRNYASSKWCLRELAKMVECCSENKGHVILPIFYYVDPRDVRHQSGPYDEAFRLHEGKFNHETVLEWKHAMEQVGAMKGWHVTDLNGQGAVIDEVFQNVLSHLSKNYTLVTDELVGVDHHVEEVVKLLNLDSGGVTTVGIFGMGGIGKTTIATAVYNKVSAFFDRCSFVDDVRETLAWSDGISTLQNKLIYGITKDGSPIGSMSEGIHKIKDRVCQYKVLVVLDDVDDEFSFEKILGWRENFFPGSRFIITTRNRKVLTSIQECKLYEPGVMSFDFSFQLFCKYAFRTNSPPEDYETLAKDIVYTTAGLPLSLKVVGSLLFQEDKSAWEEKLMQLKEIPSNEVVHKLKISYDALTYEEQQIFLDIACFFIGEDKEIPSYFWRECNFYPVSAINVLLVRSLLKVGKDHKFRMHDQLRDLGKAIVREENVENQWQRSRVHGCRYRDLRDCSSEENKVRAMEILGSAKFSLFAKDIEKFPELRYLVVNRVGRLTGDFSGCLCNLRWLRLISLVESSLNVQFKNLVILDLSRSRITSESEAWSQLKVARNLKVLILADCARLTKVPDLSAYANLELLNLERCSGIVQDLDIGSLKNLKVLKLRFCRIRKLIGDVSMLLKLEEIDASSCTNLEEIPSNVRELPSLKVLKLTSQTSCQVSELPTSLKELAISSPVPNLSCLRNLEELQFEDCHHEFEIPGDIWKLSKLKTLKMWHVNITNLLAPGTGSLPSYLKHMYIEHCQQLENLPDLSNLKHLMELRLLCPVLREIPGLGELKSLVTLTISDGLSLRHLDGLDKLLSLTYFTMDGCAIENLPDLASLKNLQALNIWQCPNLIEIQGLGESLQELGIGDCSSLLRIPDLSRLARLRYLALHHLQSLANINGLESLEALEYLEFRGCQSVEALPSLSQSSKLKHIILKDNGCLGRLGSLKGSKLEKVEVSGCSSLEIFPDLSGQENLKEVIIDECLLLFDVQGLETLGVSLKVLQVTNCKSIKKLPTLSNLGSLEILRLQNCENLIEVKGLEALEFLKVLDMSGCKSIEKLPNLSNLGSCLETLSLNNCERLIEMLGTDELSSLKVLDMSGCKSIEKLPNLSNLGSCLETLSLNNCEKLIEVLGTDELSSLKVLDMSGCRSIEKLPNLSNPRSRLRTLSLSNCEKLIEVSGIEELRSLKELDMNGCKSIEKLPNLSNLRLKSLYLSNCEKLIEVSGIEEQDCLTELEMNGCKSIEMLELSKICYLETLSLSGCENLRSILGLDKLRYLRKLDISGCKLTHELPVFRYAKVIRWKSGFVAAILSAVW
ncbi:Disease resistance protein L6 [Linum perenne]